MLKVGKRSRVVIGKTLVAASAAFTLCALGSLRDAHAQSRWSGAYFGANAGYSWSQTEIVDGGTTIGNPPYGAFACGPALTGNYCNVPFKLGAAGAMAGVQVGYNWHQMSTVAGVEGDIGWLGLNAEKTLIRPFLDRDIASVKFGTYGTLAGRLGFLAGNSLIYAKAGVAAARIKLNAADIDLVGNDYQVYEPSRTTPNVTRLGWALGAGIEQSLTERVSLKAEYLFMNFGSFKSGSADGDVYKHSVKVHTARIGINLHFAP